MNARIQLFILFAILLSGTPAIAQPPTDRVAPADSISDDDLISVVFLLKNRYRISQRQLAAKVEKAWSVTLGTENDATDFVVGRGDQFIISVDEKFFIVHVINQRYIDSLPENTRLLLDRDVQRLIEEHRAWISVDLLSAASDEFVKEEAYAMIGKLMAELINDDCLLVYLPEVDRFHVRDESTVAVLQSPKVVEAFSRAEAKGIVHVPSEDREMRLAVEEARRRWPEFAEAFAKRKANEDFLVKMQFTDETQSEFMWITVEQIENEVIKGKLENQPMFIDNLKVGDTVQVPLRDLNDWVMVRNGEMVGGFTIKVLEKKASGKRAP